MEGVLVFCLLLDFEVPALLLEEIRTGVSYFKRDSGIVLLIGDWTIINLNYYD